MATNLFFRMKYDILDKVDSPADLKQLSVSELKLLCTEIRDYMIKCCSKNPGHLGSSLGAVEMIVGLHYIYDAPKDKIIFDVSHQAYAHKILTGRRDAFRTIRQKTGISGFTKRSESPYDAFGAGHSSTSISAALGFAEAAKIKGSDEKAVAFIGDGAMSGGMAFEALNNASESDILIVLNDNNISIDQNIGALHNHLLRLTTNESYNNLKKTIWTHLGEGTLRNFAQSITNSTKSAIVRGTGGDFFEAMGYRYFGPINGNDIDQVVSTLSKLHSMNGPKLLHVVTTKGKGFAPAEEDQTVWHAPGKFDPETGERMISEHGSSRYQDVFGDVLIELSDNDDRIVGVTPAMASGCGMKKFSEVKPDRFFDVGIAEEHAVTFSAGLAASGLIPFCNIYSSFSQRAYDQIIHDVALQHLPVIFCFDRAGLVGEDGATHHGLFDMAAYRSIPGVTIASPKDEIDLKDLMYSATINREGPYIIRYPRAYGEGVEWKAHKFKYIPKGESELLVNYTPSDTVNLSSLAIVAFGPLASRAKIVAEEILAETGYCPEVLNLRFLKPLPEETLTDLFSRFDKILTIEDGCIEGGVFGAVAELATQKGAKCSIHSIAVPDRFITHGELGLLHQECGMDKLSIKKTIQDLMTIAEAR